ncbi:hypothetical protein MUO32_26125 [Shinella sp. CPCC 101442]|uniref:hypothetical protein n=1 Tax=Shinella sp. CPCC 101442 TaxID=2932265 RepID=UPI002152AAB2|nr:hypothetical protein [Shinella sp. CPCC 101442]MCR6502510.1 hypothetical protein [Shinella sp. CPCC 101442]
MTETPTKNIWAEAYKERQKWEKDSDEFVRLGERVIKRRLVETPGFAEFDRSVAHYVSTDKKVPGWMQVWFGNRPMSGRRTEKGAIARESGPSLVYSRGPSGEMAVIMYPVKSDVANVYEDAIILRIGFMDYWDLYLGVRQDMRDLMAYAYVSSIDLKPSWTQSLRIKWLRWTRRQIIDEDHHYPAHMTALWKLAKMIGAGSVTGIFRLLGPGLVGWLIGMYGNEWLKSLMPGGN